MLRILLKFVLIISLVALLFSCQKANEETKLLSYYAKSGELYKIDSVLHFANNYNYVDENGNSILHNFVFLGYIVYHSCDSIEIATRLIINDYKDIENISRNYINNRLHKDNISNLEEGGDSVKIYSDILKKLQPKYYKAKKDEMEAESFIKHYENLLHTIINRGANPDYKNQQSKTAVELATELDCERVCKLIKTYSSN